MSVQVADAPLATLPPPSASPTASPAASPAASPTACLLAPPAKRPREALSWERGGRSVRFSHIDIRMHGVEMWGGGGVPVDDGPPLGLSWHVEGERRVGLDEYETQRLTLRRPKETYCSIGSVKPRERTQILLLHGSTPRQINTIKKEIAKLNRERWQASEILFNDSWLFSTTEFHEAPDILAVIGQTESDGVEVGANCWSRPAELAAALAAALQAEAADLFSESEEHLDWACIAGLLQGLRRNIVFLVDYSTEPLAMLLIGRFVACVHTAHVAAQVSRGGWCRISVVLRGYQLTHIVASWENDETDEFCVAALD
ncbi:hypothetical protein AB1Y20_016113 [Prymnesium parvum]|uniref:Uncharacterized protein n=1 Tax=Prymnesium parvum TaxID=97485 RepID=A0AB34JZ28_PRYPA